MAALLLLIANLIPDDSRTNTNAALDQKEIDLKVNRNLFMTNKSKELEQEKRKVELDSLPKVGEQIFPINKLENKESIDFSNDRNEETAVDDLDRYPKNYQLYDSPHFNTQQELTTRDQIMNEKEKYKHEYARQFIENARQSGYEVKLSEDFVVLSVKRIKSSTPKMQILDPGLSGSN